MTGLLFKNTGRLLRFLARQNRLRMSVWIVFVVAITLVIAVSFTDLYDNKAERQAIAETMHNPALTAMVGKGYGLNDYTFGAMMAHQMLLFTAIVVAIMSILLVTRHTRAEEEDGRMELMRSLPTGRLSNLMAVMNLAFFTNLLLALLTGIGLFALGIESMDLEGSLLYGASLGAIGYFFAAVTAVFAQLSESSRGANGLAFLALGIAYMIRAMGDVSNEALSWFSPLGWILGGEVYVTNYWWPMLLTFLVSLLIWLLAFYLNHMRDMGAGFLTSRPGKKRASKFLTTPVGLLFRIQRTTIIAWAIGLLVLGASYGSVLGDLESFFADVDIMQDMLTPVAGYTLTEQFIAMLMSIMAMFSTIPVLMAMLKVVGEEKKHRIEHFFSRAVSRHRLLGSTLVIAFIVAFVMLSLTAIGLWSAGTAVIEGGLEFTVVYKAALVYVPAVWVMLGITITLIGVSGKFTNWIWGYLIYSFIVVYLGNLIRFPEWMIKLSPYGHIPQLPIEDMNWDVALILTAIAVGFTWIGFIGYRNRDMEG
ncbi:ABC transporter permease [Virgibacillus pantothenticus]|uniref:ABC transporter permease n=1 Tax=Virgibacillus pantothenticus TaxID=1473 RepID=A0A0L0QK89_VIRPA|nr:MULTISPECIES: ABC transporter permease [Virgibacillus]API92758.1 ABC transporter permease [Virgibacillus sp. 6R]KNE19002.1 ABC transporter permease [Virgibacillus pantothenticus]MBS7428259.1 ABC transporter permease [Virgibacillus sp. 19R1-5]MBU8565307.1 ABC transporter permease [Virgibacillus pantothenticus]MBU8599473.1 ABC transporter permease [Virgibacillus pantothenticus]